MAVITVSRQLGSGGATVAHLVAAELDFRLVDRELIEAVAERAGVSERAVGHFDERAFDWAHDVVNSFFFLCCNGRLFTPVCYRVIVSRLVREYARRENVVILGRGAQVVLGLRPDALHVHVVAPLEERVARVVQRERVRPEEARRMIRESDESRRRYVSGVGRRDWSDPTLYDLVLDTGRMTLRDAAGLVVDGARHGGVIPEHLVKSALPRVEMPRPAPRAAAYLAPTTLTHPVL